MNITLTNEEIRQTVRVEFSQLSNRNQLTIHKSVSFHEIIKLDLIHSQITNHKVPN